MSYKTRRGGKGKIKRKRANKPAPTMLSLENLEPRVLLDVPGLWDEMGWRSGSGSGISNDVADIPGEVELVLTSDGDPVAIWVEGTFNEYVDTPIAYSFEVSGNIYAKQYADTLGWWDISSGSGDQNAIGNNAKQIDVAAGPSGEIVVVWTVDGATTEIYARMWNGMGWVELGNSASGGGISDDGAVLNEKPSVAMSESGEVFVSYTALHPETFQREIVVKRFGYDYEDRPTGAPQETDLSWVELVNEHVGLFGEEIYSGVSADPANSFDSSIAIDLEGRPIVAWTHEKSESNIDVVLKRWDGASWNEFGYGSASDIDLDGTVGISDDVGVSIQPNIAVAGNGDVIVTWINWANWEDYDLGLKAYKNLGQN